MSNKTGSLPAVLAARHVAPDIKIIVVSELEKVLPFDPAGHEENDPAEVARGWHDMGVARAEDVNKVFQVKNVYFEWVDAGLIDHYVTDGGIMSADGLSKCAEEVRQRADGFFLGL